MTHCFQNGVVFGPKSQKPSPPAKGGKGGSQEELKIGAENGIKEHCQKKISEIMPMEGGRGKFRPKLEKINALKAPPEPKKEPSGKMGEVLKMGIEVENSPKRKRIEKGEELGQKSENLKI